MSVIKDLSANVDCFVGNLHDTVILIPALQPTRDLLWRTVILQLLRNDAAQFATACWYSPKSGEWPVWATSGHCRMTGDWRARLVPFMGYSEVQISVCSQSFRVSPS